MRKLHFKHYLTLIVNSGSLRAGIIGFILYFSTVYFMSNPKVFDNEEIKTVKVQVDKVYESWFSQEDRNTIIFFYNYSIESKIYKGKSYSEYMTFNVGDSVSVNYVISKPKLSRIVGTRDNFFKRNIFTLWLLFAFGFLNLATGLFLLLKRIAFVKNGTLIRATYYSHFNLIDSAQNGPSRYFRLTLKYSVFKYNDITRTFYFVNTKNAANKFDFKLLVDTAKPKRSIIANNLSKSVLELIEN